MQHVIKSAIIPQISKLNDLINSTPDTGSMKFGYVLKKHILAHLVQFMSINIQMRWINLY